MYDVHRLRLLRELSVRGTLAAVAEALGYSPSAVSHQLSVLEREVGVPLLEPLGRGVRLTTAATALVAHTEVILRELDRAEASIAAGRAEVGGVVRIASFQTAAHVIVPAAIAHVQHEHPGLAVEVSHIDAAAAIPGLIAREYDVVLSERYPGEPPLRTASVETDLVMDDPLLLALPPSGFSRRLSELHAAPWVMEHAGASVRTWSVALCRGAGFEPRVRFQSSDVLLHAHLIAEGLAVGVLPRLVHDQIPHIRLIPLSQSRAIELSLRSGSAKAPAIAAVRSALLESVAAHHPQQR